MEGSSTAGSSSSVKNDRLFIKTWYYVLQTENSVNNSANETWLLRKREWSIDYFMMKLFEKDGKELQWVFQFIDNGIQNGE